MNNLFSGLPDDWTEEFTELLLDSPDVRIERIVSLGHASPEGFWYDQDEDEWVAVLQGQARLLLEGDEQPRTLGPGDHLEIPAHQRHRVVWTTPSEPTIWLAVWRKGRPTP